MISFMRDVLRVVLVWWPHSYFQLDPTIYESLQKEKVEVGDVIYIEASTGSVKVGL